MSCTAARRAVVVLTTILLGLVMAVPANALAATSSARRHHRHHRRHRHRRARRIQGGTAHGPRPAPQDACANSGTSARAASVQLMRAAVVCEINLQRSAHGLPGLAESGALDSSAQGWSQTMVATNQFSHGPSFSARISAAGYPWGSAGENIASGYLTPRAVVARWMASLEHCRNILSPTFRDVGIGEVPAGVGGASAATWTGDFALRLGASAPSGDSGPADGCPY
jgi:uncharacterized protein YkwD